MTVTVVWDFPTVGGVKVYQNKMIYREKLPGWIDSWMGTIYLIFISYLATYRGKDGHQRKIFSQTTWLIPDRFWHIWPWKSDLEPLLSCSGQIWPISISINHKYCVLHLFVSRAYDILHTRHLNIYNCWSLLLFNFELFSQLCNTCGVPGQKWPP